MRALTKKESIRFMKFMLYLKSVGLTGKINQKIINMDFYSLIK